MAYLLVFVAAEPNADLAKGKFPIVVGTALEHVNIVAEDKVLLHALARTQSREVICESGSIPA